MDSRLIEGDGGPQHSDRWQNRQSFLNKNSKLYDAPLACWEGEFAQNILKEPISLSILNGSKTVVRLGIEIGKSGGYPAYIL